MGQSAVLEFILRGGSKFLAEVGHVYTQKTHNFEINAFMTSISKFELHILEQLQLLSLDVALKATPAIWWTTHKNIIEG